MVRVKVVALALLVAILAISPALHNHSLIPTATPDMSHATNVCAACVAATARVTSRGPAIATPVVIALAFAPTAVSVDSADACGPVPSRAPPAA
jgi:hypothetical protein